MAKENKAEMSCARVKKYTASDVSKAERHNERKNESYEKKNRNILICKHEVLGGFFTDKSFNLENPQKVS